MLTVLLPHEGKRYWLPCSLYTREGAAQVPPID